MNICPSCGKGSLLPVIKSSPYMIVKEIVTGNEIQSQEPFVRSVKNKWGYDEDTTNHYLNMELGRVGLQLSEFTLTNLYMHVPPKGGRTKEQKATLQGCLDYSLSEFIKLAEDKKIILLMGAQAVKLITGYGISDVYGLTLKSEMLPNVPVIVPAPNSDKMLSQPIGEMRLALRNFANQIKLHKEYSKV